MYDSIRIKKRIIHTTILQYHNIPHGYPDHHHLPYFSEISPIPSHPHPPSTGLPVVYRWSPVRTCGRWSAASSGASRTSPTPTSPPSRRPCWWSRRTCEAPRPASARPGRWGERDDGEKPREKPTGNWEMKLGNALFLGIDQILMDF